MFIEKTEVSAVIDSTDNKDNAKKQIAALRDELGAYIFYSITLYQYFTNIDQLQYEEAEAHELDGLARARRLLGYSIPVSRGIVTDFRQTHKISMLTQAEGNRRRSDCDH